MFSRRNAWKWTPLIAAGIVVTFAFGTSNAFAGEPKSRVSGNCDWMNLALPTPFVPWGDYGQYFLVSGGDFESDLSDWTLEDGATTVSGNETYQIGSPSDSQSLLLPSGSAVTTPNICVTAQSPDLRVAVLHAGKKEPKLRVYLNFTDDKGNPRTQKLKDLSGSESWTFTDPLKFLGPVNSILKRNGQTTVSFTFAVESKKDSQDSFWQLDDVYVDPYKSG